MVEQTKQAFQLREKLLLSALYVTFFIGVFMTALYWTFPYDRLRDFIADKLSATDGTSVEIGELGPVGISGVRVRDFTYSAKPATADAAPNVLRLSEVTAKLSLLPLLFGTQRVALDADVGGGTLEGTVERNSETREIDLEFSALDVGKLGIGSWLALPLQGKLSGKIDLSVPSEVAKITGSINLEGQGMRVGDGKAKLKPPGMAAGFTLDEIDAGKLKVTLDVKNGIATLTHCSADGKDLKLNGKGSIRLADPWKRSRPDLDLDLTFSPAYKNKSDRTKAMFEILAMQPDWQRATGPDGAMHLHVTGTFLAIRGTPGR